MGTRELYLVVGKKKGIKYYFLSSSLRWTPDIMQVTQRDLNESKIEVQMESFPDMDPEYTHEPISVEGDFM